MQHAKRINKIWLFALKLLNLSKDYKPKGDPTIDKTLL